MKDKKIVLNGKTWLNAIQVVDTKTKQVFRSQNLNMTLTEYILMCENASLFNGHPHIPSLIGRKLKFVLDGSGETSKGYKYKASAYFGEFQDAQVFVNVIDGVE